MKRRIRNISCFTVLAMVLLVHPAAAESAENKDDGMGGQKDNGQSGL